MEHFSERFPIHLFVKPEGEPGTVLEEDAATQPVPQEVYSAETIARLRTSYQALWDAFAAFTKTSRPERFRNKIRQKDFVHSVELAAGSAMFLQCKMVNHRLALTLEQRILDTQFKGIAGFVLGGNIASHNLFLMRELRAIPTAILDIGHPPRIAHLANPTFETYAKELLDSLTATRIQTEQVAKWVEDTERIVAVPEVSLIETTEWLQSMNDKIAADRQLSAARASEQHDEFMHLFASLANPRVGA
jgi:hypothetical protein